MHALHHTRPVGGGPVSLGCRYVYVSRSDQSRFTLGSRVARQPRKEINLSPGACLLMRFEKFERLRP